MNARASSHAGILPVRALDRTFALPAARARFVFEITSLTRAPGAPAHILGVTNLRGEIVAVICLARRLDPFASPAGVGSLAVAIEMGSETLALAVESAGAVVGGGDRWNGEALETLDLTNLFAPAGADADGFFAACGNSPRPRSPL